MRRGDADSREPQSRTTAVLIRSAVFLSFLFPIHRYCYGPNLRRFLDSSNAHCIEYVNSLGPPG